MECSNPGVNVNSPTSLKLTKGGKRNAPEHSEVVPRKIKRMSGDVGLSQTGAGVQAVESSSDDFLVHTRIAATSSAGPAFAGSPVRTGAVVNTAEPNSNGSPEHTQTLLSASHEDPDTRAAIGSVAASKDSHESDARACGLAKADCVTNSRKRGPMDTENQPAKVPRLRGACRNNVLWSENDVACLWHERHRCMISCARTCTWEQFHTTHWSVLIAEDSVDDQRNAGSLKSQFSNLKNRRKLPAPDLETWRFRSERSNLRIHENVAMDRQDRNGSSLNDSTHTAISAHEMEGEQNSGEFVEISNSQNVVPQDRISVANISTVESLDGDFLVTNEAASTAGNPPDKTSNKQTCKVTKGPENNSRLDVFQCLFLENFKSVVELDRMDRRALKLPKKVSQETWQMCDSLFSKYLISNKRQCSLKRVNQLVYALGLTIIDTERQRLASGREAKDQWYKVIQNEIRRLRNHIGYFTNELNRRKAGRKPTPKERVNFHCIRYRYSESGRPLRTKQQLVRRCESLKCQLKLAVNRLNLRKADEDRIKLRLAPLRNVLGSRYQAGQLESVDHVRAYWDQIIGKPRGFEKSMNLLEWEEDVESIPEQTLTDGHQVEFTRWKLVLGKARPRKSPGPDGIPNLLWKQIGSANKWLFNWLMQVKVRRLCVPNWFAKGRVFLLPKKEGAVEPGDFRPIACLNTCYKLVTAHITSWLTSHVATHELMPKNQLALTKGTWGCTHALVLDRTIASDARYHRNKELACAWLDFSKAFDCVPHSFIKHILCSLKVKMCIRNLICTLMSKWHVCYELRTTMGVRRSKKLHVRRGVLQGDCLSPLLFCMSLIPLIHTLNNKIPKYITSTLAVGRNTDKALKVSNIWYMDDVKLFGSSRASVQESIELIHVEMESIKMELNPRKCAILDSNGDTSEGILAIPAVGFMDSYKYLGVEERFFACETLAWERVKDSVVARFSRLLESDLSAGQARNAYNCAVIPICKYFLGNVVNGTGKFEQLLAKATKLDSQLRGLMESHKFRYPKSAVSRLYLDTKYGGLGFKSMVLSLKEAIIYTWCYIACRPDLAQTRALMRSLHLRKKRNIHSDLMKILDDTDLVLLQCQMGVAGDEGHLFDPNGTELTVMQLGGEHGHSSFTNHTKAARFITRNLREVSNEKLLAQWRALEYSSKVSRNEFVDQRLSYQWIAKGMVNKRAMRDCLALQESALYTNRRNPNKDNQKCRQCHKTYESMQHVASGCNVFRHTLQLDRHNGVARALYTGLIRKFHFKTQHYSEQIMPVVENDEAKLYWDFNMVTRRELKYNKPDIVVFDKLTNTITVIEVCCCWYENMLSQHRIKYHKYATNSIVEDILELDTDNPRPGLNLMGQLGELYGKENNNGIRVIPVIVGACGEVLPGFDETIRSIGFSRKESSDLIEKLERAAVLGTSRLLRAHLAKASE